MTNVALKELDQLPSVNPRVAVYLSEETKKRLEIIAKKERRSLSQMALILIEERLNEIEQKENN